MVKVIPVQSSDARMIWEIVSPLLQKAIDKSSDLFSTDDILRLIEDKRAQLWIAKDSEVKAAIVTTIENSSKKWLRFMYCGGKDFNEWEPYIYAIEQWGKSMGCEKSVVYGREGWERKLKDYEKTAVILEKPL